MPARRQRREGRGDRKRSNRPSGEIQGRRTRPTRFGRPLARPQRQNQGRGDGNASGTGTGSHRPAGKTHPGLHRFCGGDTFAAFGIGRARWISRGPLHAVAQRPGPCARGNRGRERGYQQQKTGQRGAEKAESPTKKSILLPWCRQTPCLSISPSVLEIPSSGQYVGGIGTVHPPA